MRRSYLWVFFTTLIIIIGVHRAHGQEVKSDSIQLPDRFFQFTPGYAFQQGRDEGMSPLIYSGHHFSGLVGIEKTKNKQFNQLELTAMFGRLRAKSQPEALRSSALALRAQLDYCHERFLRSWLDEDLKFYLGGSWNNLLHVIWHQRYLNNSLNYAFSSSLGPSARFEYRISLKQRKFRIRAQLQLPVVAFNLRPAYASSLPEGYIAQDRSDVRAFFDSGELQTLNKFFRLRNLLQVHYELPNNNEVMLGYRWDYYSMQHEHLVQMAVHQILLGWRFHF